MIWREVKAVKAVQIGILAALIVVAGLLGYIAWHDHTTRLAETTAAITPQTPPDAGASQTPADPTVSPLTPADEKPSPAARVHKGTAAIAQNTPPPSPPVEAAPTQPVQPAQEAPRAEQARGGRDGGSTSTPSASAASSPQRDHPGRHDPQRAPAGPDFER